MATAKTPFEAALAELKQTVARTEALVYRLAPPVAPDGAATEPPLFVNVPGPAMTDEQIERLLAQDAA